jgi:hypothetical protein
MSSQSIVSFLLVPFNLPCTSSLSIFEEVNFPASHFGELFCLQEMLTWQGLCCAWRLSWALLVCLCMVWGTPGRAPHSALLESYDDPTIARGWLHASLKLVFSFLICNMVLQLWLECPFPESKLCLILGHGDAEIPLTNATFCWLLCTMNSPHSFHACPLQGLQSMYVLNFFDLRSSSWVA